jgi:hypothetical protein
MTEALYEVIDINVFLTLGKKIFVQAAASSLASLVTV